MFSPFSCIQGSLQDLFSPFSCIQGSRRFVQSVLLYSGFLVGLFSLFSCIQGYLQVCLVRFLVFRVPCRFVQSIVLYSGFLVGFVQSINWLISVPNYFVNHQNTQWNAEIENQNSNRHFFQSFGSSFQSHSLWVNLYILHQRYNFLISSFDVTHKYMRNTNLSSYI